MRDTGVRICRYGFLYITIKYNTIGVEILVGSCSDDVNWSKSWLSLTIEVMDQLVAVAMEVNRKVNLCKVYYNGDMWWWFECWYRTGNFVCTCVVLKILEYKLSTKNSTIKMRGWRFLLPLLLLQFCEAGKKYIHFLEPNLLFY